MINEAVILAGGLGTRLRSVVSTKPKPMADINGRPFLEYVLHYLEKQGITKVVLAVGYMYETIVNHFSRTYKGLEVSYSIEEEPLGTGGALRKALTYTDSTNLYVLNGDTLFMVDLKKMRDFHVSKNSVLTVALKRIEKSNRYGSVTINEGQKIVSFQEKSSSSTTQLINGGVYLLSRNIFEKVELPEKFSFEKDFLERYYDQLDFYGFVSEGYFIDIGVPEDYERAQQELSRFQF
ncbi:MAG: NTP transferase domain-containing protein [Fervidobacterium sp.]|uniref:nucleotidyltransferase family protein n=1 Tax=Fervidobacterium sp. TaxID=1871331 RepID=UPI0025C09E7B|nr:nucleotidyltransferase family protein [Fervidobacterium sp.]NPU88325.1 NTP transferase domain-containing protein [Fervidobacterium sp.]